MELDFAQLATWFFEFVISVIGIFLVKSASGMKTSIDQLNIQVGQLLVHKDNFESRLDKIEDRLHDHETKD